MITITSEQVKTHLFNRKKYEKELSVKNKKTSRSAGNQKINSLNNKSCNAQSTSDIVDGMLGKHL